MSKKSYSTSRKETISYSYQQRQALLIPRTDSVPGNGFIACVDEDAFQREE